MPMVSTTLEHQPVKVMAMEGHFDSHPDGAPLILFGIPNTAEKRIDYAIEIPKLSSLILKHDLNAPLAGLDTIPDDKEPPVAIVFWSFRVMVAIGFCHARRRAVLAVVSLEGLAVAEPLDASCSAGDGSVGASSRCSPAGSPPRSVASPIRSTAIC